MTCEIGHPSWMTFLSSAPTICGREKATDQTLEANPILRVVLQHPISKNIASGRFFNNLKTRGYAGIFAILSSVNLNPRMQGYGKT